MSRTIRRKDVKMYDYMKVYDCKTGNPAWDAFPCTCPFWKVRSDNGFGFDRETRGVTYYRYISKRRNRRKTRDQLSKLERLFVHPEYSNKTALHSFF